MSIAAELLGSLLAAISRSSFVKRLETCSPMGTNISYVSGSRSLSSTVRVLPSSSFWMKTMSTKRTMPRCRQIQELGDDLA